MLPSANTILASWYINLNGVVATALNGTNHHYLAMLTGKFNAFFFVLL